MKNRKIVSTAWIIAIFFALAETALADLPGTPTLLLPSDSTTDPIVYAAPRPVQTSYRFTGVYYDPVQDSTVPLAGNGTFYGSGPASLSEGYQDAHSKSWVDMSADAAKFDAKIKNYAWSDGLGAHTFVNTGAGVGEWFVLKGATDPVALTADILFQGQLFASYRPDSNNAAFFSHGVGFLSSPRDLTQDYIMQFGGGVTDVSGHDYSKFSTVPLLYWAQGPDVHEINYMIRSQPFTVEPDVPFRLNLFVNAAAYTNGTGGEAYSNFYDPGLSQFQVYQDDGTYVDLADLGYSVNRAVPEPVTLLLLGMGLMGLACVRKKP